MLSSLLFISLAVYAGLSLSLFLFQSRLIYFPTDDMAISPAAVDLEYEEVFIPSSGGVTLHAWMVPAESARYTVLHCHGNAGNISHRLESLLIFHRLGLGTLIFDYAGYGRSDGRPGEQQTYEDAEAAWRYLTVERGIAPERIIIFGQSLGGAIAAELASRVSPAGLIVESTFTSVPDRAAELYRWLPVRWLARIRYEAKEHIRRVDAPVLVIHSKDDEMIPIHHGKGLFDAAPEPKTFLELSGSHNDGFLLSGNTYTEGLAAFVRSL